MNEKRLQKLRSDLLLELAQDVLSAEESLRKAKERFYELVKKALKR